MNRRQMTTQSLAAMLTGAVMASALPVAAADGPARMEKCYGIAKAGENGCAHAKGLHSCAGQSGVSFDGGDWKLVKAGDCDTAGGAKAPFVGVNPKTPKT